MLIVSEDRGENQRVDLIGRVRVREHRVEVVGFVTRSDAQMTGKRPSVARGRAALRATARDVRAAARCEEAEKRDASDRRLHALAGARSRTPRPGPSGSSSLPPA